jgi:hypothetical protein
MVYDLAALSYKVGRIETDGISTQAKYNKLVEQRDDLKNKIATLQEKNGNKSSTKNI